MRSRILFTLVLLALITAAQPVSASGLTWQPRTRVSDGPGAAYQTDVASAKGVLHVVWTSSSEEAASGRVFYRRSLDGGATWEPRVKLRGNIRDAQAAIAAVGDRVHVAWIEDADVVVYRASHDGGETWERRRRLSPDLLGNRDHVSIAAWADSVHVAWGDSGAGSFEIFHRRSLDGGSTWRTRTQISPDGASHSHAAGVAVRQDTVHICWWENPGFIQHRRSDDDGATWSSVTTLDTGTPSANVGWSIAVAITKSSVLAAWLDWGDDGETRIAYRRSGNGGRTWNSERPVSWRIHADSVPDLASGGDRAHIVWSERLGDREEIFYRKSLDGGINWKPLQRLTWTAGTSAIPRVDEDARVVHVVWRDDLTGNNEIYVRSRS